MILVRLVDGKGNILEVEVEVMILWSVTVVLSEWESDEEEIKCSWSRVRELNWVMRFWICCGVKFCKVKFVLFVVIWGDDGIILVWKYRGELVWEIYLLLYSLCEIDWQ